jgi:hypothetical protein
MFLGEHQEVSVLMCRQAPQEVSELQISLPEMYLSQGEDVSKLQPFSKYT